MEHRKEHIKNCPVCGAKKQKKALDTKDYFLSQEDFSISRCEKCGFHFTNPRPKLEDLGPYYESEEYISHSNSNEGLFGFLYQKVRKYTLKKKYELVNSCKSGDKILDIGCATGQFLNEFKLRGWDCTGIEPDADARDFAKQEYHLKVWPEEDIDKLEDQSFDVISMWHVLEHVGDLEQRLKDLKRLIKANGVLFIALPNRESWDAQHYGKYWAGLDVPRHLYHFSKSDVQLLFNKHDFEVTKILPMKFDSYYVSLLSEKYKKNPIYYVSAFFKGFYSNLKAQQKEPNHSSLIYVIKPKIV